MIVLGAPPLGPGVPGPAIERRLDHAVAVFRAKGAAYLVPSGGVVGAPPAEAEIMRTLARGARAFRTRGSSSRTEARNTFENALYTGLIMRRRGWRRVVVVTDAFHMPRALYVYRRLGLTVSGDPGPRPPAGEPVDPASPLRPRGARLRPLRLAVSDRPAQTLCRRGVGGIDRPMAETTLPLRGIRVLDAATFIAAPLCATLFAEFGAEVIKVEHPRGGDPFRRFGTPTERPDCTLAWLSEARNKASITLDLGKPQGAALFKRLVGLSDVVCENFRPGTLERWGLGWDELVARSTPAWSWCGSAAMARPGPTATARVSRASPMPWAGLRPWRGCRGRRR